MKLKQLIFSLFAVSLMSFTTTPGASSSDGHSSGICSAEACCDSADWRYTCWLDGVRWDAHIYKKDGDVSQN